MKYIGMFFAAVGLSLMLHGGLSLCGGFGLERYVDEMEGLAPRGSVEMWIELIVGAVILGVGIVLYSSINAGNTD